MSTDKVFYGDVGGILRVTIKDQGAAVDLSTTTERKLIMVKPDGVKLTKDAAFTTNGTDGKLQYTFLAGDLSVAGDWRYQFKVTFPTSGPFHSDIKSFRVMSVL